MSGGRQQRIMAAWSGDTWSSTDDKSKQSPAWSSTAASSKQTTWMAPAWSSTDDKSKQKTQAWSSTDDSSKQTRHGDFRYVTPPDADEETPWGGMTAGQGTDEGVPTAMVEKVLHMVLEKVNSKLNSKLDSIEEKVDKLQKDVDALRVSSEKSEKGSAYSRSSQGHPTLSRASSPGAAAPLLPCNHGPMNITAEGFAEVKHHHTTNATLIISDEKGTGWYSQLQNGIMHTHQKQLDKVYNMTLRQPGCFQRYRVHWCRAPTNKMFCIHCRICNSAAFGHWSKHDEGKEDDGINENEARLAVKALQDFCSTFTPPTPVVLDEGVSG